GDDPPYPPLSARPGLIAGPRWYQAARADKGSAARGDDPPYPPLSARPGLIAGPRWYQARSRGQRECRPGGRTRVPPAVRPTRPDRGTAIVSGPLARTREAARRLVRPSGSGRVGAAHPAAALSGALVLVQPTPGPVLLGTGNGVIEALD